MIPTKLDRSKSWMNKATAGERAFYHYKGVIPPLGCVNDAPWRIGWALAREGKRVEDVYILDPKAQRKPRKVNPAQDAIDEFAEIKAEFEGALKDERLPPERKKEMEGHVAFLAECLSNARRIARVNLLMGGVQHGV